MVVELIVFDATEEGVGVDDVANVVVIVVRVDPGVGAIVVVVVIALSVNIVAKFSEVESDSVSFKEVFSPAVLLANDASMGHIPHAPRCVPQPRDVMPATVHTHHW